jgi:hypothetical protein
VQLLQLPQVAIIADSQRLAVAIGHQAVPLLRPEAAVQGYPGKVLIVLTHAAIIRRMTQSKQGLSGWWLTPTAAIWTAAILIGWLFWWPLIQYSYHYWLG